MKQPVIQRKDLIYPELCYQIIGILFEVYNQLGYGHSEKVYQKAVAVALKKAGLKFVEQIFYPILFNGTKISGGRFDFLIEDKIVLEIKKGDRFAKGHIDQLYGYLVNSKLKLGILAYFAPRNLHYKRIVNIK
ncbi:MAG: GxxExxY protein [Bacteroidetes bacterium]|nr:GxxExxY protein [Bacteroidota bacterium]